jgi:hypothetical protein
MVALSGVRLSVVSIRFCGTLHLLKTCLKASRLATNRAGTKVLSIGGAVSGVAHYERPPIAAAGRT